MLSLTPIFRLPVVVICGSLLLASLLMAAPLRAEQTTEAVFEQLRDRLLQIQVIDLGAGSKAGIGSGFVVGRPDWIVTNYHVIAGLVNRPGGNRAEWIDESGEQGALEILAVDAVHDLALMRAEGLSRTPIELRGSPPAKGERLLSLGNPFDLGQVIVEGTYNGIMEKSLYRKVQITGSINPGMSGGPSVDANGMLVGVNVATAGNQVSFLVPARYVRDLLASAEIRASRNTTAGQAAAAEDLRLEVGSQLMGNQERLVDDFLKGEVGTTALAGFRVPSALTDAVNCWGQTLEDESIDIDFVVHTCKTSDDIFLAGNHVTGVLQYEHQLLTTSSLGRWQFYRQVEGRSQYPDLYLTGDEEAVRDYDCVDDFVDNSGMLMKVTWCLREYRRFPGLHDAYLSLVSMVDDQQALKSSLVLGGVSRGNAGRFAARFLSAYGYNPEAIAGGGDD